MSGLDLTLLRELNLLITFLEPLWRALGDTRAGAVYALILAVLMISQRRWWAMLVVVVAVGLTDVTASRLLKPLVARERPCALGVVTTPTPSPYLPACGSGQSFPSSHAANSMAVAVAVSSPPLAVVSLLVGVSRVVLGQHYPSDVAAGWTLGAAIAWVVRVLAEGLGLKRDA